MKSCLLFLIVLCAIPPIATAANANARDDVLAGISRCGGISDDRSWLDCVYGAAQPMRAQLGLLPALASQQKLVPPAIPGVATVPVQKTTKPSQQIKWPFSNRWPF